MAVFGRDTLITCLQTLLFGPELAQSALEALAELQATEDDASIDAEPGKIVHEVRHGKGARAWFPRYYGTVDATPLYLILLSEVWRWTDDAALVRDFEGRRCARSSGSSDTATSTATASSSTSGAPRGLDNQSWKDSGDSQKFSDGTLADAADRAGRGAGLRLRREAPRRPSSHARSGATESSPSGSSGRPRSCARASTRPSGSSSAAATTRSRSTATSGRSTRSARTSATCSGAGSSRPAEVDAVVDRLMGEELWSGWGVRTMSAGDAGFNPLEYHNGTVWPHDNSLIAGASRATAAGRRRSGSSGGCSNAAAPLRSPAARGLRGLLAAETPFPIAYPTAAGRRPGRPARPVLLLQILLGLRARPPPPRALPRPARAPVLGRSAQARGVRAFGKAWDVRSRTAACRVEPMRDSCGSACSSPCGSPCRRRATAASRWVVSLLADGLADAGHDVTLFASGDSRTKAKLVAVFEDGAVRADRALAAGDAPRASPATSARASST